MAQVNGMGSQRADFVLVVAGFETGYMKTEPKGGNKGWKEEAWWD